MVIIFGHCSGVRFEFAILKKSIKEGCDWKCRVFDDRLICQSERFNESIFDASYVCFDPGPIADFCEIRAKGKKAKGDRFSRSKVVKKNGAFEKIFSLEELWMAYTGVIVSNLCSNFSYTGMEVENNCFEEGLVGFVFSDVFFGNRL